MKSFLIILICAILTCAAFAEDATPTTSPAPTTRPGESRDVKVTRLLDYLEALYAKKTDSPDWVSRGMGVISLSRSPRASATNTLMTILQRDSNDVVRMLAWQAILARLPAVDEKTHAAWMRLTIALADKGTFRGPLRVEMINVLATEPSTIDARRIFEQTFSHTNAWESTDIPTLDALGSCAAAWKNRAVIEMLIGKLMSPNDALRAEYVLRAAGCGAQSARDLVGPNVFDPTNPNREHPSSTALWALVHQGCLEWYHKHPEAFAASTSHATTGPAGEAAAWRSLPPKYVDPPADLAQIDPDDPAWRQDLELGRVNLEQFQVVFVVDATGSMGDVLEWLQRDIGKMMTAISAVSKEANIGITFYRDTDDSFVVKHVPLTGRIAQLMPDLNAMTADGGGDIPEAVYDGLDDALHKNKWSTRTQGVAKLMIIVGDAPPHDFNIPQCMALAHEAAGKGFRIHAVKVSDPDAHNDLHTFDDITKAAGGTAIEAYFPSFADFKIIDGDNGKPIPIRAIPRPEAQLHVATALPEEHPGEKIMSLVIADAMNPQYRDRVQPLVRTLLSLSEPVSPPEKRLAFPADTPPLERTDFDAQKR